MLRSGTIIYNITRREGLPEEQNFDIFNSFQTELQEPQNIFSFE